MKRKALAILIATVMATEIISTQAVSVYATTKSSNVSINSSLQGTLEVRLKFDVPLKLRKTEDTKLNLSLKLGDQEVLKVPVGNNAEEQYVGNICYKTSALDYYLEEANDSDVYYYDAVINNLPKGTYTLEINGEGFAPLVLKEKVEIKDYSKRIYIGNDREVSLVVDVDGDNVTTEKDYKSLLENIGTSNLLYDLNRDGVVDIADLAIVHEAMNNNEEKKESIYDTSAIIDPSEVVILEEEKVGVIHGEIKDLFEDSEEGITIELSETPEVDEDGEKVFGRFSIEVPKIKAEEVVVDVKGITEGTILVETEDGRVIKQKINNNARLARSTENPVSDKVVINLEKQVAVKKITIKVNATDPTNTNLAQIGKVEFLNDVYQEVPKAESTAPTILEVETDDETVKLKWLEQVNIDGYEVSYKTNTGKDTSEKLTKVGGNSIELSELENFEEYEIKVRSYSGETWKGEWSKTVKATPAPKKAPDAPENINIVGEYRQLNISWKKMKGAEGYNLFYRAKGEENFNKVSNITGVSTILTGLEDNVTYEVYLTSYNSFGESGKSKMYTGTTLSLIAPEIPNYKLLNTVNEIGEVTNHIVDVTYPRGGIDGNPVTDKNKFAIVDGDFTSAWLHNDWDTSIYSKSAPIVEFDNTYAMDTIMFSPRFDKHTREFYNYVVRYWDEEGNVHQIENEDIRATKKVSNGKPYYVVKLPEAIKAKKVQLNLSVYGGGILTVSEMKFYHYDSIEDDVRNLFKDDLLIELNDNVTQDKVNELRERANTSDVVSGEYHPNQSIILDELKLAEDILNDENISKNTFTVNQNISNSGNNLGLSNDYQALGYTAKAGEEIVVYVGTEGNVLPELAFTQHYGESGKFINTVKLKKGKNVLQVPAIHNLDVEKGGSIYVRYPNGNPSNKEIKIRISGAKEIPHLNVYGDINDSSKEGEVKESIREYIRSLKDHVDTMKDEYPKFFANKSENKYKYDEKTSILNTTDIETTKATLNLPASAILNGITSGLKTEDEQVDRLYDSLQALEQIMELMYAQRGVSANPDFNNDGKLDASENKHLQPRSRVNIKYQRMFAGAFMYASGHHVGIEYDSASGLVNGKPYTFNEDGTVKESGALFGWGIAHEIGHVTEMNGLGRAEVTNNVIALLAQTLDDKAPSRLESSDKYTEIYEKVTSETIGLPGNVFTQLGMFWQLHLAYDENPTSVMLITDRDSNPTNDSFYARLSKRAREASAEDSKLSYEQKIVRYASDVVQKDLTDFFKSWGIIPSEENIAYMDENGYEKEGRKIQYLNDNGRRQILAGVKSMSKDTTVEASLSYDDSTKSKSVELTLGTNKDSDKILGYEIYRNGKVIGFTTDSNFTDYVSANNRVFTYEVVAYDYHLNKTEKLTLDPIKVSHDGSLTKNLWEVETNTSSSEDVNDENNTTGPVDNPAINKIKDNSNDTIFKGDRTNNQDPYVIVNLNEVQNIVGLRYTAGIEDGALSNNTISNYQIFVSKDKENWTLANSGKFDLSVDKNSETVYFNEEGSTGGKQLWSHEASYVKIVAPKASGISMAELDIIAPPGDNVDLKESGVGTLSEDFIYGKNEGDIIPKGSIIFTGEYRGNPAFNAVLLRDKKDNVIEGEQILLAEVPENGHLGEISSGTWIFYLTPDKLNTLPKEIRAELYRVNDAETLEGQRLVSDTLYVNIPEVLPEIKFEGGIIPENMR
ncbi:M60 family metallopeptidase [Clostridium sp.]|uniref:M60 family metallopeptidase n=1 Tax=Clostridium sp. TaxID=1506 RepID=UPI001D8B888A|nr:M60 family metallopeptidase [Clostridium sp.]MBS5985283.1 M60 family metallopeptidase [Clostridium sp.]